MAVTAAMVKELREITNAGMLDCKKALEANNGDIEKSVQWLREKGIAKAAKKADRVAAEGLCNVCTKGNVAYVFELNSETDFVAKNDKFLNLIETISNALLDSNATSTEEALNVLCNGETLEQVLVSATATIGEKISLRRVKRVTKEDNEVFGLYKHQGGRIVCLTILKGENAQVAKDVAMHVAAINPKYVKSSDMSKAELENETHIIRSAALEENKQSQKPKPEAIVEKMVAGRLNKYLKEICLVDQPFVKNPDVTVGDYVKQNQSEVVNYVRLEVGEGIVKEVADFASEVMAQIKQN